MSSLDSLLSRYYAAEPTVGRVVDDTPVVIRIKDVAGGTSTPTVVFTDTFSDLTITDSDGTVSTWDLSAAAYNTMGELVDAINGTVGFEAKLLDALRSDASNDVFVTASVTSSVSEGETVFDCCADTSAVKALTYRATIDRGVVSNKPKGSHRVKLGKIIYNANVSAAENNAVRVYKWDAVNKTETLVWSLKSVDVTETTITFANLLTAGEGNDYIIRVMDTTSLTDSAGVNFMQVEFIRE